MVSHVNNNNFMQKKNRNRSIPMHFLLSQEIWRILTHLMRTKELSHAWMTSYNEDLNDIPNIMIQRGQFNEVLEYLQGKIKNKEHL